MALWDSFTAEKQKSSLWSGYKPSVTFTPSPYAGTLGDINRLPRREGTQTSTQALPDERSASLARFSPQTIAREAAQGVARTVGNVGVSAADLASRAVGQPSPFPEKISAQGSPVTETLFGKEQTLSTFWKQYEEMKPSYGLATAPLIAGGVLLDLAGLGGERAVIKTIIKTATEEEAVKTLMRTGAPEDVAKLFAPRVVATKTAEEARALLKDVASFDARTGNTFKYLEDIKNDPNYAITKAMSGNDESRGIARILQQRIDEGKVPQDVLDDFYKKAGSARDMETGATLFPERGVRASHVDNFYDNSVVRNLSDLATKTETPRPPEVSPGLGQVTPESPLRPGQLRVPEDLGKAVSSGVNVRRLLISPEGKAIVTKAVEDVKPLIQEKVGTTLTNKEALTFAENTSRTLKKAIGREETLAWEAGMLRARQQLAKASETGAVDADYIKNLILVKSQATDIARKLQSLSIGAEPIERGGKQAIVEAVLKVSDDADAIIKAAEGVNFQDLRQATEFYRKFVKPTATEWVDLLRYNSMLSSPLTHIINITANLLNTTLIAPLEKALTGGLDFLGSKLTGKARKQFAAEGAQYYRAYLLNVKKAFVSFADVMAGKKMYTNLDTRHIPIATKGVKGEVVSVLSFPSRLLEGMDQFFMALGEGGERAALQYRVSKGVKVENIDEAVQKAAAYRVYRQKPGENEQGMLLDALDRFTLLVQQARNSENPLAAQVAKFTVPFLQTPMNILKQGIEFSPLGFLTIPGAKNKTEQLSRAIMGSAVFAGAATLLGSNRITFAEPRDETGKRDFRAAGQQPYSVKFGDTWYSYQKLPPPIAFPFVIVASINQAVKEKKMDEGTADVVLSMIAKYGQFLSEQSYVKNVGDAISSLTGDPEGVARLVGNYAQQLIPFRAFGGWLARLSDPVQRKIDSDGSLLEKQVQLLMLNVPGLSDNVPARLDAEGKPIPAPNPVGNAISPVRSTRQSEEAFQKYQNLMQYKKEKKEAAEARSEEKDRIQPLYDEAQLLLRQGDTGGAQAIVDGLSKEEYEIYKAIKTADHSANTAQLRMLLNVAPRDAVKFLRSQLPTEQKRLLKVLTDEEYQLYESGKTQLEEPQASAGSASNILGALTGARRAQAAAAPPEAKTLNAIAYMETRGVKGDPYTFVQPSGDKALGRALGKYQITEYFLKKYSPRYLGRVVTAGEFLKNPRLQDDFMLNRIKYLGKQGYTPEQIADIHRHGSTNEPGSLSYKRPQYVEKFKKALDSMR